MVCRFPIYIQRAPDFFFNPNIHTDYGKPQKVRTNERCVLHMKSQLLDVSAKLHGSGIAIFFCAHNTILRFILILILRMENIRIYETCKGLISNMGNIGN
jgi:hypothetical protein